MQTAITLFLTIIIIIISVFLTLIFKYELERVLRDRKASLIFHISNILITYMPAFCMKYVMTVIIFREEFHYMKELFILTALILPIYLLGSYLFNKYQFTNRKYSTSKNEKIYVLNEKYLQKKKPFSKLKKYNAFTKDK